MAKIYTKEERMEAQKIAEEICVNAKLKMYFMEELSIREISRRSGLHRDTISKYLATDKPMPPKYQLTKDINHPILGPYIPMIQQILTENKTRHRKQRHTGTKILEVLKSNGYQGGYTTITDYLRKEYRKQRRGK